MPAGDFADGEVQAMAVNQQIVDQYVDRAVEEFKKNPLATKLLRRFSDEMPDLFCQSALRHLEGPSNPDACRLLSILMMRQQGLFQFLSDPVPGTRDKAIRVMRRMMAFDPSFDVRVAGRLPDRGGMNHHVALHGRRATRILDILDEVSVGRRLLPVLSHLVQSDDKHLSAKATLFVGRRVQSAQWAANQLQQPDPRIRANAVESLWGLVHDEAISVLENSTKDKNNRVVGNGLMGLHILNQPVVFDIISEIMRAPKWEFRSTAAWIMGRMAYPEFVPDLTLLMKDDNPFVRTSARKAIISIRRAQEATTQAIAERGQLVSNEEAERRLAAAEVALEESLVVPGLRLDGSNYTYRRG